MHGRTVWFEVAGTSTHVCVQPFGLGLEVPSLDFLAFLEPLVTSALVHVVLRCISLQVLHQFTQPSLLRVDIFILLG